MEELLDVETAAKRLNISVSTLYHWVEQRKISFRRVGRKINFSQEDLNSAIQEIPKITGYRSINKRLAKPARARARSVA
jgi:excisionase family DNA binding protein